MQVSEKGNCRELGHRGEDSIRGPDRGIRHPEGLLRECLFGPACCIEPECLGSLKDPVPRRVIDGDPVLLTIATGTELRASRQLDLTDLRVYATRHHVLD